MLHMWPRPSHDHDDRAFLEQYLTKLLRKGHISPTVLVSTLVLMNRGKEFLTLRSGGINGEWRRCHLITAVLVIAGKVCYCVHFAGVCVFGGGGARGGGGEVQ